MKGEWKTMAAPAKKATKKVAKRKRGPIPPQAQNGIAAVLAARFASKKKPASKLPPKGGPDIFAVPRGPQAKPSTFRMKAKYAPARQQQ